MENNIKSELEFCKSIDCEANKSGAMIYTSTNGASSMNLPYILKEYIQWREENKIK